MAQLSNILDKYCEVCYTILTKIKEKKEERMIEIKIGPGGTVHVTAASTPSPVLINGHNNPTIAQLFGSEPIDQASEDLTDQHLPAFSLKAMLMRENNIVGRSIRNARKRNRGKDPQYKNRAN